MSQNVWDEMAVEMRREFTISFWVNPEGGQPDPATIFGEISPYIKAFVAVSDLCERKEDSVVWKLELRTKENAGEEETRLHVQVKPRMSSFSTNLRSVNTCRCEIVLESKKSFQLVFGVKFVFLTRPARVTFSSTGHVWLLCELSRLTFKNNPA